MTEVILDVADWRWRDALKNADKLATKAVTTVLELEGHADKGAIVNVTLSSDAKVHVLNREWRGKDQPTNVLSFPLMPIKGKHMKGVPLVLGDIILARQTLLRESRDEGKTLKGHFLHLVVHGTLHLLGHDHMNAREALRMEKREILALAALGVPNPYATASTKA